MLLVPCVFISVKSSGTSVSLKSIASWRQQQASQFAQVASTSGGDANSLVMDSFSIDLAAHL